MKKILFIGMSLSFLFLAYDLGRSIYSLPSEKERLVTEIESKTAKQLKQKLGLIPFGYGGQMMDQIQILMLSFQYKHPVTLEEGRRLLVQALIEYLREINSNEKIRKYLKNYPFQPRNIEISIYLRKPDGSSVDQGDFEIIISREGKLEFKFTDPNFSTYRTYEETLEEACKILKAEKIETINNQKEFLSTF